MAAIYKSYWNYMAIQVAVELTVNMLVSTDVTSSTISTELEPINIKQLHVNFLILNESSCSLILIFP